MLAAALLHDTIEGTRSTKEEICCRFGKRVASIVMELTDDKSLPKHRREELQVEYAPLLSIDAALVKVADKIYNLRDLIHCRPEGWLRQQIAENFEWAKEVVNSLPPFPSVLRSTFAAAYGSASKS